MNALHVIENIAQKDDRSLAVVFFFFFARFEYALKRAGFVAKADEAKADWNAYAQQHVTLLEANTEKCFHQALVYIVQRPPKKQLITAGQLSWSDDRYTGPNDLARVLTLVCRIRNNLFHGGKFQTGVETDLSRDQHLLKAGLTILQGCLDSDPCLQHLFLEGLNW